MKSKKNVNIEIERNQQFVEFYETQLEKIYQFVFYKTNRKKEVAEDITSEVFLKAYRSFQGNWHITLTAAWIYRICNNHIIDYYRTFKNKTSESLDEEFVLELEEVGIAGPKEEFEKKDIVQRVLEILKFLTPIQKEVIILKYINDYSNNEIAEVLGITSGAVRVRVFEALKKMKSYITKEK